MSSVRIIPDKPLNGETSFGFDAYIKTLLDLIANSDNETPFVIGIYGEWGSGKTTLMQSVQKELDQDARYKENGSFRKCKTVWFQAWKYDDEKEILAGLVEEIFKTMERDKFFEKCKAKIEKIVARLKPTKLLQELVKHMTGVSAGEFFGSLQYKEKLGFYDIFQEFFDRLIWAYLNWRPQTDKYEVADDNKGALVIFIDDLDRCPRQRIIKVLETIKLFMDKEGCIFVIGASNSIIMDALRDTYKEGAERFMDKIVQVTFNLPRIPIADFKAFCEKHCSHIGIEDMGEYLPVILPALNNNPRNLKRFFNDLSLLEALIKNRKIEGIEGKDLLLWNIIEYRYPSFRKAIKGSEHRNLSALYDTIDNLKEKDKTKKFQEIAAANQEQFPDHLKTYASDRELLKIIDTFQCNRETLDQILTLTGIVESQEEFKRRKDAVTTVSGSVNMVSIPGGDFPAGDDKRKETIEKEFEIDIYPVTNAEYQKFMKAGGYADKNFWTDDNGWKWKEKNHIGEPKHINDDSYNDPEQPVVGVSWYEAKAYTKWLTDTRNNGFQYRLPTEWEWEKAARGEDRREYPWGDEFDVERCNSAESNIKKPTRVTVYPNGRSPYGCYDMAGNVREWTLSFYDQHKETIVLRGGSFFNNAVECRSASRSFNFPVNRHENVGFRCIRIKL